MMKDEMTPSESEWMVMDIFWSEKHALTSREVIERLGKTMTSRMVLLLIMLLRITLFQKTVFLKGLLWVMLIPVPFMGKCC